jgi:hypothetical protein
MSKTIAAVLILCGSLFPLATQADNKLVGPTGHEWLAMDQECMTDSHGLRDDACQTRDLYTSGAWHAAFALQVSINAVTSNRPHQIPCVARPNGEEPTFEGIAKAIRSYYRMHGTEELRRAPVAAVVVEVVALVHCTG